MLHEGQNKQFSRVSIEDNREWNIHSLYTHELFR